LAFFEKVAPSFNILVFDKGRATTLVEAGPLLLAVE